jgi:drug/metabolite transporter (DMT)-like permease
VIHLSEAKPGLSNFRTFATSKKSSLAMRDFSTKYAHWIILFILVVIWGSSFILMKRSLEYFTPYELGALRISFAGLALLPFALRRLKGISPRQWLVLIVVGLIGNTIPAFLFSYAQTGIPSAQAGILNSTTPLFALLVGLLVYHIRVSWMNVLGVFLGLFGAVMVIAGQTDGKLEFNFYYSSFVILASILYAFNLNIIKHHLAKVDSFTIAAISYFVLLVPILLYLFLGTSFMEHIRQPAKVHGLIYPAILGVVGSALAITLFNKLIKLKSVIFSASVTYLIPIVALGFGVLDGEHYPPLIILWVAIIIFGVFLVNKKVKSS